MNRRDENQQKKPKIRTYTDRTGVIYEISEGKGKIRPTQGDPLTVHKIGYFSSETIRYLSDKFNEKHNRRPTLTEIAEDLFMSPQSATPGGLVVYLDRETKRYSQSQTI